MKTPILKGAFQAAVPQQKFWRLTKGSARQPLNGSVHPKVQHCLRLEAVLKPLVESSILRVRCQVPLKEQAHGVPFDAQDRLDANPDIAHLHPANQEVACTLCKPD